MESLGVTFTDVEQSFYAELFANIDSDTPGRVGGDKAVDLLNRSQLSADVIERVSKNCNVIAGLSI